MDDVIPDNVNIKDFHSDLKKIVDYFVTSADIITKYKSDKSPKDEIEGKILKDFKDWLNEDNVKTVNNLSKKGEKLNFDPKVREKYLEEVIELDIAFTEEVNQVIVDTTEETIPLQQTIVTSTDTQEPVNTQPIVNQPTTTEQSPQQSTEIPEIKDINFPLYGGIKKDEVVPAINTIPDPKLKQTILTYLKKDNVKKEDVKSAQIALGMTENDTDITNRADGQF
jgi:hypothetical protein